MSNDGVLKCSCESTEEKQDDLFKEIKLIGDKICFYFSFMRKAMMNFSL